MGEERVWRGTISLIRLHFVVEGYTEQAFVDEVLAPELAAQGVFADAHRVTTGRRHGRTYRGGLVKYEHLVRDTVLWMKQDADQSSWFTTMIDFYGLPADFPGREAAVATPDVRARVAELEAAFTADITDRLNGHPVARRLVPYIQLHEFEALLFSDLSHFRVMFPEYPRAFKELQKILNHFGTPEEIDEGIDTAPSKRIRAVIRDYEKRVAGVVLAQRIGLPAMRRHCSHFDAWITHLLALGGQTT